MKVVKKLERTLIAIAVTIIVILCTFDIMEDYSEGVSLFRSLGDDDVLGGAVMIAILIYMWKFQPVTKQIENLRLKYMLKKANSDAALWQSKASELLRGLGEKINQQFDIWRLTNAEKEVALFLIKGLAFKEIAFQRGTNEKTVRQQASNIYSKASLENRAEFSAFFLEDLLLPNHDYTDSTNTDRVYR